MSYILQIPTTGWWGEFWTKHDPDDVCKQFIQKKTSQFDEEICSVAYSTLKVVRIRDKRLGLLHHTFQFTTLMYILVHVMLIKHSYLKFDQARFPHTPSLVDLLS